MTKEKQTQRLEQRLTTGKPKVSKDLIKDYLGKHVVLEVGEEYTQVCSGNLTKYDGRFIRLENFIQHNSYINQAVEVSQNPNHDRNLSNPKSIEYSLPSRTINVNLVASIQAFEEVTQTVQ